MAVQLILFNFADYSPSMNLKQAKELEIRDKYVSRVLFLKSQTAEINFEKLLG